MLPAAPDPLKGRRQPLHALSRTPPPTSSGSSAHAHCRLTPSAISYRQATWRSESGMSMSGMQPRLTASHIQWQQASRVSFKHVTIWALAREAKRAADGGDVASARIPAPFKPGADLLSFFLLFLICCSGCRSAFGGGGAAFKQPGRHTIQVICSSIARQHIGEVIPVVPSCSWGGRSGARQLCLCLRLPCANAAACCFDVVHMSHRLPRVRGTLCARAEHSIAPGSQAFMTQSAMSSSLRGWQC